VCRASDYRHRAVVVSSSTGRLNRASSERMIRLSQTIRSCERRKASGPRPWS
jgi:hypothetical protein